MNIGSSIYFVAVCDLGFLFSTFAFASDHCFEYVKCDATDHCECGKKIKYEALYSHGNARVINAKPATHHYYPWMAQIQRSIYSRCLASLNHQKSHSKFFRIISYLVSTLSMNQ